MRVTGRAARLYGLAAFLCFCVSCKPDQPPEVPAPEKEATAVINPEPSAAWNEFVEQYIEDFFIAHPAFAVAQGRHEFDGMLPDWSAEGIAREITRLEQAKDKALAFSDEELHETGRFQREYLISSVDGVLFWLDKAEWPFLNPAFYIDPMPDSLDPDPYITLDYAALEERMKSFIRYAGNIPMAAEQIRSNLRMPMARTLLQYGIDSFGGMADYFTNDVPAVFETVEDAALQVAFVEANSAAAKAMRDLSGWLQGNLSTATEGFALGPELFLQMMHDTERVDLTLEELEALGRSDMRRNQIALGEACAEFAPGESVRSCFALMAGRKPPGGAVKSARLQVAESRAFLVQEKLLSIPGNEVVLVAEAPPYARSDIAYINIPGPYEENRPSVYYISSPDPDWPVEMQQAYVPGESALLSNSVHEVWPGHFLNMIHARRSNWVFGRLFVSYAYEEGWAHYAEEMMLEAGFRGASAELRVGQISEALTRNARFLSSIGLHTQGMSVEESERLFREDAYQDEATATQQAARGTYDPAYLNHTLGKLMIRELRSSWTATREGRQSWRDFHNTFLSFGGPPIPLLRARMLESSE